MLFIWDTIALKLSDHMLTGLTGPCAHNHNWKSVVVCCHLFCTNYGFFVNWTLWNTLQINISKYEDFHPWNMLENDVCQMVPMASWPWCVNTVWTSYNMIGFCHSTQNPVWSMYYSIYQLLYYIFWMECHVMPQCAIIRPSCEMIPLSQIC